MKYYKQVTKERKKVTGREVITKIRFVRWFCADCTRPHYFSDRSLAQYSHVLR